MSTINLKETFQEEIDYIERGTVQYKIDRLIGEMPDALQAAFRITVLTARNKSDVKEEAEYYQDFIDVCDLLLENQKTWSKDIRAKARKLRKEALDRLDNLESIIDYETRLEEDTDFREQMEKIVLFEDGGNIRR